MSMFNFIVFLLVFVGITVNIVFMIYCENRLDRLSREIEKVEREATVKRLKILGHVEELALLFGKTFFRSIVNENEGKDV